MTEAGARVGSVRIQIDPIVHCEGGHVFIKRGGHCLLDGAKTARFVVLYKTAPELHGGPKKLRKNENLQKKDKTYICIIHHIILFYIILAERPGVSLG